MHSEAGLVALVVLRDVALVGGAVYKRASSLGWKVNQDICLVCYHQSSVVLILIFFLIKFSLPVDKLDRLLQPGWNASPES